MTEKYGWDQTPTPDLGLDITKAPADIQKLYKWVIQKTYGEDVASAYGQGLIAAGIIAKNAEAMSLFTSGQMDKLDQFVKDTLIELTEKDVISAPEIIMARNGEPTLADRLDRDILRINSRLDDVSDLNPDNFEGANDIEKLQNCVDWAIANQTGSIVISLHRMFDLTGGTIYIDKVPSPRLVITFSSRNGGGILKTDSGFVFDTHKNWIADIILDRMYFKSIAGRGTTIINGEKIILVTDLHSFYFQVDRFIYSSTYVQSIRTVSPKITGGSGTFIEVAGAYDCDFDSPTVEGRTGNYFDQIDSDESNQHRWLYGVYFRRPLIQGLTGFAIRLNRVEQATIDMAYFEMNKGGNVVFRNTAVVNSFDIRNTRAHEAPDLSSPQPLVKWAGTISWANSFNNRINNAPVHDTTAVINDSVIRSEHDVSGYQSKENIDPYGRIILQPMTINQLVHTISKRHDASLPGGVITQVKVDMGYEMDVYSDVSIMSYSGTSQDYEILNYVRNPSLKQELLINMRYNGPTNETLTVQLFITFKRNRTTI